MHPEEIKAAVRMKGMTLAWIADQLGVSRSSVGQVLAGSCKSKRIQHAISDVIGRPIAEIWPGQVRMRRERRTT